MELFTWVMQICDFSILFVWWTFPIVHLQWLILLILVFFNDAFKWLTICFQNRYIFSYFLKLKSKCAYKCTLGKLLLLSMCRPLTFAVLSNEMQRNSIMHIKNRVKLTTLTHLYYIYITQCSVSCEDYASEWTDHIFTMQTNNKIVTYLHIYKMENCLDVVGLDLWFKLIQRRSRDNVRW
jgi:hypothetical protein